MRQGFYKRLFKAHMQLGQCDGIDQGHRRSSKTGRSLKKGRWSQGPSRGSYTPRKWYSWSAPQQAYLKKALVHNASHGSRSVIVYGYHRRSSQARRSLQKCRVWQGPVCSSCAAQVVSGVLRRRCPWKQHPLIMIKNKRRTMSGPYLSKRNPSSRIQFCN